MTKRERLDKQVKDVRREAAKMKQVIRRAFQDKEASAIMGFQTTANQECPQEYTSIDALVLLPKLERIELFVSSMDTPFLRDIQRCVAAKQPSLCSVDIIECPALKDSPLEPGLYEVPTLSGKKSYMLVEDQSAPETKENEG